MTAEEEIELEELEIEEYGKRGGKGGGKEQHPRARRYVIRVDKTKYPVDVSHMKGREILTLAGKLPPEQYKLRQKFHGGAAETIGLDEDVDFRKPGVERFMTLKLDQTDG
ncbi:MAG: multiubiquitin domain-containing protein [Myxococcota bacterium]